MNENVCRTCRRYAGRASSGVVVGWLCARRLTTSVSEVVPGHSYFKRDQLHPMAESRAVPPDWCEKPLEQVILKPEDAPVLEQDSNIVHDGNFAAEAHVRDRFA